MSTNIFDGVHIYRHKCLKLKTSPKTQNIKLKNNLKIKKRPKLIVHRIHSPDETYKMLKLKENYK